MSVNQEITIKTNSVPVKNRMAQGLSRFIERVRSPRRQMGRFGRTTGVIWEWISWTTKIPVASIVQIERGRDEARVTIFDNNDPLGTSATNRFEEIASGVYLEHLASEYRPDAIQFFHRDIIEGAPEPQWGTMPVQMTWNPGQGRFENPRWDQWKPDFEIPESERAFVRELRQVAAVEVERFMRERHQRGETTPREEELYKAFQHQISAQAEVHRYNLRGGWLFGKPETSI